MFLARAAENRNVNFSSQYSQGQPTQSSSSSQRAGGFGGGSRDGNSGGNGSGNGGRGSPPPTSFAEWYKKTEQKTYPIPDEERARFPQKKEVPLPAQPAKTERTDYTQTAK